MTLREDGGQMTEGKDRGLKSEVGGQGKTEDGSRLAADTRRLTPVRFSEPTPV